MESLSVKQINSIDEEAIIKYKIPRIVLMENAGLKAACLAVPAEADIKPKKISVFACGGYNGGDGFVVARHLFNRGHEVNVFLVGKESKCKKETAVNLAILKKLKIPINVCSNEAGVKEKIKSTDIIIDAMLGVGFKKELREPVLSLINIINSSKKTVICIDVPSGLDSDTGEVRPICVKAVKTVTFTAVKKGFFLNKGPDLVGEVILADVGIPSIIIKNTI